VPQQIISRLNAAPGEPHGIQLLGHDCTAEIYIPDAAKKISAHYHDLLPGGLSQLAASVNLANPFQHFGVRIKFRESTLLEVYDRDLKLAEDLKSLIAAYGAVILENTYMSDTCRNEGQRNIFPDLDFHYDRSLLQPNHYSLYCRDPFDETQRALRDSSTLIIPNVVAFLQQQREGAPAADCKRAMYKIFRKSDMDPLVNSVILEQGWRAPEGTGEICLIDNHTVLHASYYRYGKGYPIGVRYLY